MTAALWPLSVDGLVILASVGLLRQHAETARRARWAVRSAFLLGVVVSLAANIAAAPALAWQPIVVAGWPPLALLLAIELVLHGRHRQQVAGSRSGHGAAETAAHAVETVHTESSTPDLVSGESAAIETGGESAVSRSVGTDLRPRVTAAATSLISERQPVSRRVRVDGTAEEIMWSFYQRAVANGRTPTGAELDRIAGTSNYGRAVLARWRRAGRLPPAA